MNFKTLYHNFYHIAVHCMYFIVLFLLRFSIWVPSSYKPKGIIIIIIFLPFIIIIIITTIIVCLVLVQISMRDL